MKTRFLPVAVGMLVLLLVGACSNQPPQELAIEERLANLGYVMGEQIKFINNFQVSSWSPVDRKNVIIYAGASRNYLVTTRSPCDGLQETRDLAFSKTIGNLTDKDRLLVGRYSGHIDSCSIDTLHKLQKLETNK